MLMSRRFHLIFDSDCCFRMPLFIDTPFLPARELLFLISSARILYASLAPLRWPLTFAGDMLAPCY